MIMQAEKDPTFSSKAQDRGTPETTLGLCLERQWPRIMGDCRQITGYFEYSSLFFGGPSLSWLMFMWSFGALIPWLFM